MNIKILNRYDNKVILCGEYESIKDCLEKNRGAYLEGANLKGAKNYYNSIDFAIEIIRRQDIKFFTPKEWQIIGQVIVHRLCWKRIKKDFIVYRLCWEKIKKDYGDIVSILEKLDELGYSEYLKKFREL